MSFSIQTEDNRTYLIYTIREGEEIDTFSLGMQTENKIAGLAEVLFTQMDAQKFFVYNITAKIPASQLFSGMTSRQRIVRLFLGITDALISAEEYMLPTSSLQMQMDMIFCDVVTEKTVLICLPLLGQSQENDPCTFLKNILFNTQFDQSENCEYVTTLLNYLNSHPVIPYADFRKLLLSLNQPEKTTPQAIPSAPVSVPPEKKAPVQIPVQQPMPAHPVQQPLQQPVIQALAQNPELSQPPFQTPAQKPPVNQPPFQVPTQQKTAAPQSNDSGEKPMSMLYLLRHYSAENKAIYDAQRQTKDSGAKTEKSKKSKKEKPVKTAKEKKPAKAKKGTNEPGFQVPNAFQREEYYPAPNPAAEAARSQAQQSYLQQQMSQQPVQQPIQQPIQSPIQQSAPQYVAAQAAPVAGGGADFGDTDYFSGGNSSETVLLGADSVANMMGPYLLRIKNNERIPLNKPLFRIGREAARGNTQTPLNDYVVADNPYVGNSHAVIISRNGEYFLIDNYSQNHSYLNGEQLTGGMEAKLSHGARFTLANEEFEFKLF